MKTTLKFRIHYTLLLLFSILSVLQACGPERLQQSSIYRAIKKMGWINEGWGFPVSVTDVSSWNSDCKPSLTADGKYLYFISSSQNGPPYEGHIGKGFNVYVARWNGAQWDSVTNLGPNINPASYSCISADGNTLYITKGSGIYVSYKTPSGFSLAQKLPDPINGPDPNSKDRAPFISANGQELYFASNRQGGYGKYDLYRVKWNGTAWDSLMNLGDRINTSGSETHPALTPDGQKLYFSDFGGGRDGLLFGDADLFVSYKDSMGWPEGHLVGPPINIDLPCCSVFPTADGKLYLGSEVSEGGVGEEDIWIVREESYEIHREVITIPGAGGWTNTGELEGAWYVHSLIEADDGSIYAGTSPNGDVFRSTNKGQTWIKTAELDSALKVYSLLQTVDETIYAGTYPLGRVFKTTNQGSTWEQIGKLRGAEIVRSLIQLSNGTLMAGTSPDSTKFGRIFISNNNGQTWQLSLTPPLVSGGIFTLIELDKVILASGRTSGDRFFVSQNNGQSWKVGELPWDDSHVTIGNIYFFHQTDDGTLWTGGWAHGPQGIVAKSSDNGFTWEEASEIKLNQVEMARIFDMVETEDGVLVAGHPGPDSVLALSKDLGVTWECPGTLPGAYEALCLLAGSDGTIYAGTTPNGDVFKLPVETSVETPDIQTPNTISLSHNYPNPFNNSTYIHFFIPKPAYVSLEIIDIHGRIVRTLINGYRRSGDYILNWNGKDQDQHDVASGFYIYKLNVDFQNNIILSRQKKCLLIK